MKVSAEEIEAGKSEKGGWTKATLASWGVPWPPPKGWRQSLIDGTDLAPQTFSTPAMRARHSGSLEAKLLHKLVMAVIETGHNEIIASVPEINSFYGNDLPRVRDFVDSSARLVSGEIEMDDRVYRFECIKNMRVA